MRVERHNGCSPGTSVSHHNTLCLAIKDRSRDFNRMWSRNCKYHLMHGPMPIPWPHGSGTTHQCASIQNIGLADCNDGRLERYTNAAATTSANASSETVFSSYLPRAFAKWTASRCLHCTAMMCAHGSECQESYAWDTIGSMHCNHSCRGIENT